MPRNTTGLKRGGGTGRKPGVPNKATTDMKAFATKCLTDKAYVDALKRRLVRGTAGAVEIRLYDYAYGKPKETHEVTGAEGGPLLVGWMKPSA
jgi:hypothetical protein